MKVAVLMGGTSAEREVSLASGECVARALRELGHEVVEIDTSLANRGIGIDGRPLTPQSTLSNGPIESHQIGDGRSVFSALRSSWLGDVEVVFIALHGGYGEDGTLQALLDLLEVPYTGSGVLACALSMDKAMAKAIFKQRGVRTPDWFEMDIANDPDPEMITARIISLVGFPVVIKPNNQGSTIGVSIVQTPEGLASAMEKAQRYADKLLFEEYIPGRELTVAIVGDEVLPVLEIHPEHGIYDYECKYTKGMSRYTVPARISPKVAAETQDMALTAFKALKCEGFARVDFRLSEAELPYCLEVNAIPGMTETSLVPKAARAVGIDFPQLVERIVKLALEKE